LKIGQYLTKIWTITKWDVSFETQCTTTTTVVVVVVVAVVEEIPGGGLCG